MATLPPDPAAAMGAEAETPAGPVKTICISQQADGSFSVYEEAPEAEEAIPGMEPGAGMGGGMPIPMGEMAEGATPGAQQAATVDEALELARQMLSPEAADRGAIAKQVWSS